MIPSATANSGAARVSSSLYSPIQKLVAGKAVSSAASSCRKRRNARASCFERGQRLEAVDRDDPRPPLLDQPCDPLGDGVESVLAGHRRAEILVKHRSADRMAIEEAGVWAWR
jgi:hypothetical protein